MSARNFSDCRPGKKTSTLPFSDGYIHRNLSSHSSKFSSGIMKGGEVGVTIELLDNGRSETRKL
jgi:hypothetical protein